MLTPVLPSQHVPALDNPFSEEIFPNIQPKPPLLQLEEKAEVLNNFFASVFTSSLSPHPSRVDGWHEGDQGGKIPPAVSEDQVRDLLRNLNV